MKVSELMTTNVITVGPDAPLKEAARRMLEANVSGLVVTDDAGMLQGVITEADFVKTEADRRATKRAGLLRWFVHEEEMPHAEVAVGDVMTSEVISLPPDSDHAEAARLMETHGIKRIPIVAEGGRLEGILSRSDILRAFARSDQDIIDEITDHVMRKVLWIDPKRVTVTSVDGNVALTGQLETRGDATLLVDLTRRTDGVVSIDDHLTWEIDNTKLEMVTRSPGYSPRPNW